MLLTLSTTHRPATDLGFVLRKHPARAQSFDLTFGCAHVIWPRADEEEATVALLVDIDPVALVRGRKDSPGGGPLALYVNDRPYVVSSFMSVALSAVFGSALNGRAKERLDLVGTPMPLCIRLDVVPSRGGPALLTRLFGPLGYEIEASRLLRDEAIPAWGQSNLYQVRLSASLTVQQVLQHLYVLLPVLDDAKHYWVGDTEVEKLLEKGGEWLARHPEKDFIARRYLRHDRGLTRSALQQLEPPEETEGGDNELQQATRQQEESLEQPIRLNELRLDRVAEVLEQSGANRVLDLGCGEGRLLERLLKRPQFSLVVGVDVSPSALARAEQRLDNPRTPLGWRERLTLLQGSVTYRDPRLDGFDAAALVEVIEHIEPQRLRDLVRSVFAAARPRTVVVTTPNADYNALFESLPAGHLRHSDHRFEWGRRQFKAWAQGVASEHGYIVRVEPIGPVDNQFGGPTQMGVFACQS